MPIYLYKCRECAADWDVAKSMAQLDRAEECPSCLAANGSSSRVMQSVNFTGAGDWNTQTFHPALGTVVRNNAHARQIAKSRGLIEVGNEAPEKIHSACEKQRADTRDERWKDADRVKVYE